MNIFDLAQRYIGIKEIAEDKDHPLIQWWLSLCGFALTTPDEVPWCSAFINGMAWELRLPRSKSAAARSWLAVGTPIVNITQAQQGDIVILQRGLDQPGPDVLNAPGHVTIFAGLDDDTTHFLGLGGNQQNGVNVTRFPESKILGIRRIS